MEARSIQKGKAYITIGIIGLVFFNSLSGAVCPVAFRAVG